MCGSSQTRSRRICKLEAKYIGLAFSYSVNPESCGNPDHFHNYLCFDSLTDHKTDMAVTYVMLEEDGTGNPTAILGYVSLKATSVITRVEEGYEGTPAIEISELSVAGGRERSGVGAALCDFAIDKAMAIKEDFVGVKYLVVCSEPKSVDFYAKCHFGKAADHYNIPREGWNHSCVPMIMRLPEE